MKSDKYLRLKQSYGKEFKVAASSYLEKSVRTLMEDDPGTAYSLGTIQMKAALPLPLTKSVT